ncbi:prepilin-type N-terminal cleavage/methylation domain-containing protein [bacterium]|nr:prepilin-type N-terminal cleavage/methylation domain-containing protein [bacterium]
MFYLFRIVVLMKKAFTLAETIIVLVIVGILA